VEVGAVRKIGQFIEGQLAQGFITALIVLNAISLGLETNAGIVNSYGVFLHKFDVFVLAIFCVEIGGKLLYRRLGFFKNGWNLFDFVIVAIALVPSSGPLAVLRTLRIFRAMRLLSVVPSMRKVIQALLAAIPGIFSVGLMILLIFYVSAVLATNFFGASFDEWFGGIGKSMFTLFQIMTLESWSMGIVRPVMKEFPLAWIFFVLFILVTTFAVLNLFIGIIVDAMQRQSLDEQQALHGERGDTLPEAEKIYTELLDLRTEVRALTAALAARQKD
jgi:voltage-gated sodium channel